MLSVIFPLHICNLNAALLQLQAETVDLKQDFCLAPAWNWPKQGGAVPMYEAPGPFSRILMGKGILTSNWYRNHGAIKILEEHIQGMQHLVIVAVLPRIRRHQSRSSPFGDLQLCFLGFKSRTERLKMLCSCLKPPHWKGEFPASLQDGTFLIDLSPLLKAFVHEEILIF